MKKLFLLILILASNLFAQGWNNIVTTDIPEPHKTDIFTNSSAIHILIQNNDGEIVYYNLNSAGDIDEDKTETLETSGSFPNIVGSNDKIYAIYKTGNNIRVKYSTDNGSSWLTNIADRPTTANYCNGVDAVYQEGLSGGVHLVWATQDGGTSGFETYYARLTYTTPHSWVDYKNVTDVSTAQYGGNPSVTVSPNRVHISFNTDPTIYTYTSGDAKTRDKYNGNWQTPQTVVSGSEQSIDERLLVREAYLYLFYSRDYSIGPHDLRFRTRSVDNTTGWSDFTTLESVTLYQQEDAFEIAKTTNDYIHILCKKHLGSPIGWAYTYKYYDGTNWYTEDDFDHPSTVYQIGLSSVSDDLFCTWVQSEIPYLRFRQYDADPLAPQNLDYSVSANNHPLLEWDENQEPDISTYKVYKKYTQEQGFIYLATTSNNYYEDETETFPVKGGPGDTHNVWYYVKAVDVGSNVSAASSTLTVNVAGAQIEKNGSNALTGSTPEIFELVQNYPNPFNPTTTIGYSIPESGEVKIGVYDVLGRKIKTLIDEYKQNGSYEVTFNAKDLSSGVYIYRITASNNGRILFSDSKQMILLR
jgi:hypothetical protein